MPLEFRGAHLQFLNDHSAAIDLEGSLSCGKTTVCLCKELRMLKRYPGMHSLIARWTDDATNTLLRPALEQMARIEGVELQWNEKLKYYTTDNGSRIYSFGLKTQSQEPEQRYGKIRGLPVSRIYIDQAEQLPGDIASELLLRLRPDLEQRLAGNEFPRQLTFSPNPPNHDHWLARQFPEDNHIKGRTYYALSIFDNAHNLPPEMIDNALIEYPEHHPKYQTVILGKRGPNVIGDPIYDNLFSTSAHVAPVEPEVDAELIEAFEVGKHNPCWVLAQRTYEGGIHFLGGILGKRMMLDEFLPIVLSYRNEWAPMATIKTCTGHAGADTVKRRFTLMNLLRREGFKPVSRPASNAHDVQLAIIEEIASLLRRQSAKRQDAIYVNQDPSRWLYLSAEGPRPTPFLTFAFDGGYVWDKHIVSVGSKELRQPYADDEYANAMACVEQLVLNFCADRPTAAQRQAKIAKARETSSQAVYRGGPAAWQGY